MKNVWNIVIRSKKHWTQEGQQFIEELYSVVQKASKNLSVEDLELLHTALNEEYFFEIIDMVNHEMKNKQ